MARATLLLSDSAGWPAAEGSAAGLAAARPAPALAKGLDPSDPRASAAAKRAFFRIMEAWGASNEQARLLLGSPSRGAFFSWKKGGGGKLGRDAFERISYVIGIYKALQILFSDPAQADAWPNKPNAAFGGRCGLDRMAAGNMSDLYAVRAYLDQVRGGGS